jgi:TonB family protein
VGATPRPVDSVAQEGTAGEGDTRSEANRAATAGRLKATTISDDKMNDLDRQVFGERRPYGTTLNMPNLNSSSGSWVMHFAELEPDPKQSDLLQPLPMVKSDPGYPLELMKENVHGTVTLYAVIHADGKVDGIRVLSSPDDRLDSWAANALAAWKFLPALRAGKAVAVEAVVQIPFRAKRF